MNGEHLHAKAARGFDGSAGRVWNVVQLEIEPNLAPRRQNRAQHFWTFRGIKLQPDFEKRDLIAELLNELKRVPFCGHVQRDDDFVSCFCHSERSRGISHVCSRVVSTPLDMTIEM